MATTDLGRSAFSHAQLAAHEMAIAILKARDEGNNELADELTRVRDAWSRALFADMGRHSRALLSVGEEVAT